MCDSSWSLSGQRKRRGVVTPRRPGCPCFTGCPRLGETVQGGMPRTSVFAMSDPSTLLMRPFPDLGSGPGCAIPAFRFKPWACVWDAGPGPGMAQPLLNHDWNVNPAPEPVAPELPRPGHAARYHAGSDSRDRPLRQIAGNRCPSNRGD